jgi:hypothetical protein
MPCHVSRSTLDAARSDIGRFNCYDLFWLNQRVIEYGALLSALAFLIHGTSFLGSTFPTFLGRIQAWHPISNTAG